MPDASPPAEPFDFATFPTLTTARLRLREVTPADASALFALRGDYEVTRLNIGPAYSRPAQGEELVAHIRRSWRDRREIWWGLTPREAATEQDTLFGLCILYNLRLPGPSSPATATLGYEMRHDHWGHGLMGEATRTVLAWGFAHLALHHVDADADMRNERSARLLLRLGFYETGIRRAGRWTEGQAHDLALYTLPRDV